MTPSVVRMTRPSIPTRSTAITPNSKPDPGRPVRILDAHQHFWDLSANYLPWLADKPVNFRYGNYDAIKRNYMPEDLRADAAEFELVGSVFIETEWNPEDPEGEVAWVAGVRDASGLPSVMVAQAWLDRAAAPDGLAAHWP